MEHNYNRNDGSSDLRASPSPVRAVTRPSPPRLRPAPAAGPDHQPLIVLRTNHLRHTRWETMDMCILIVAYHVISFLKVEKSS
ncbi:hypothetical protein E2C01_022911 [Portunus trituberculatus]|uniref:Uncharacterized protein n=1 Tax=Portunus trituberculatus TaxID=210409 RepID=A0A5B7E8X6_PORTR|nr:hypothetical protein [Portunus trituberculatus]